MTAGTCARRHHRRSHARPGVAAVEIGRAALLSYLTCEFHWHRPQRANLKMPLREFLRPRTRNYLFVGAEGGMTDDVIAAMRERDAEGRNTHGLVGILGAGSGKPLRLNDRGREWVAGLAHAENLRARRRDRCRPRPQLCGAPHRRTVLHVHRPAHRDRRRQERGHRRTEPDGTRDKYSDSARGCRESGVISCCVTKHRQIALRIFRSGTQLDGRYRRTRRPYRERCT